jgi:hypothetical protein
MASRRPPSNSAPRLDLKTKLQNAAQDIIGKGEISGNSVDKLIQLFLEERGGWSTRGHEADIQIVETKIQTNTETGTVYTLLPHSTSPNVKYATWYLQPGDVSPVRLTSALLKPEKLNISIRPTTEGKARFSRQGSVLRLHRFFCGGQRCVLLLPDAEGPTYHMVSKA